MMKSGNAPGRQYEILDAIPTNARTARRFVGEVLRANGATRAEIADVTLVASELVSNIIEHGDCPSLILVVDVDDPDLWKLSVTGGQCAADSRVLEPEKWNIVRADERSGRGLGIVRQLMDEIDVDTFTGAVSVSCHRRRAKS